MSAELPTTITTSTTHSEVANSDPLVHLSRALAQHQTHLVKLYTSIGHTDPNTCAANKISDLHVGILDTIETQAREAEKEVAHLTHTVNELIDQIKNLRIRLGHLDLESELKLTNEALVPQSNRLEKILLDLNHIKFEREIHVENFIKRLENFAPILGDQFIRDAILKSNQSLRIGQMFGANLSLEYISRLEQQCTTCEQEVARRTQILHDHLNEIFNLWGHLGISPSNPSTNATVDHSDIDPIVLAHLGFKDVAVTVDGDIKPIGHCESVKMIPTDENLLKVQARQTWLDAERQKREEEIQSCYDELCILWTRLGVPEDEQEEFVESWRGLSEQCVQGYKAELKRMIEAKKEHMVIFIEKERSAIIELWDQMYVPETERANVPLMHSEDYSEELLAAHEKLKVQLMDDLNDQKPLLTLLSRYFTLLQEAHELELAEKDPNRFAKGKRGDPGRLLREEKIRKRVTKEKPKLENDLKTLIPQWENERGRPFMVNGSRFLEDLVIRLEQEAALKSQASGRSRVPSSSTTQSVKRQQTGSQSRSGSPVKRTRTGETTKATRSKPPVSAMRGSSNPFGSATPRVVSKAGSVASTAQQKLAPQPTGSSIHNTRLTRARSNASNPPVSLQYQRTGSSMSYYNPITPTPVSRLPAPIRPNTTEINNTTNTDNNGTSSIQSTCNNDSQTDAIVHVPTRSTSGQSSCPGIPPGWPSTNPCNTTTATVSNHQPTTTTTTGPVTTSLKYQSVVVGPNRLGKGMPAPPLKKGIFKPRPSTIQLPVNNHGPLNSNPSLLNGNSNIRVNSINSIVSSSTTATTTSHESLLSQVEDLTTLTKSTTTNLNNPDPNLQSFVQISSHLDGNSNSIVHSSSVS